MSTTAVKGSMAAYLIGEEVAQALINAGADSADLRKISKRPDVAEALVELLGELLEKPAPTPDPVRREVLFRPLKRTGLDTKVYKALERVGIFTLGELTTLSAREAGDVRNIGPRGLSTLDDILEGAGLQYRNPMNDPFEAGTLLYGRGRRIPARLMQSWLDLGVSCTRYLRQYTTLGALSKTSRAQLEARLQQDGLPLVLARREADQVELGLTRVGLAFRSEKK